MQSDIDNPKASKESLRPGGAKWTQATAFLQKCDPIQMRYVGHEWRRLVEAVEQMARRANAVSTFFGGHVGLMGA